MIVARNHPHQRPFPFRSIQDAATSILQVPVGRRSDSRWLGRLGSLQHLDLGLHQVQTRLFLAIRIFVDVHGRIAFEVDQCSKDTAG